MPVCATVGGVEAVLSEEFAGTGVAPQVPIAQHFVTPSRWEHMQPLWEGRHRNRLHEPPSGGWSGW